MKTLQLNVDDSLYDVLLTILKELPKRKIEIIETDSVANEKEHDINRFAGTVKSYDAINDPVLWQQEIRAEWDR